MSRLGLRIASFPALKRRRRKDVVSAGHTCTSAYYLFISVYSYANIDTKHYTVCRFIIAAYGMQR